MIVFDGDSLMAGSHATTGNDPPSVVMRNLSQYGIPWKNVAQGGSSFAAMRVLGATVVDPLIQASGFNNFVVAWGGTNDIWTSTAIATIKSDITTYCTARKAAGWKVVILTILPRSSHDTPVTFEADRQTINAWIRANHESFGADHLVDIAADSRIGDAGDELDLTYYYTDACHMNDTGYALVAELILDVLGALLTLNMTVLVIQPDSSTGKDTMMSTTLTNGNYGAFGSWRFGANAAGTRRGLIQFDLSALPSDAIISSISLQVVIQLSLSSNARTVRVFRQKRLWVKGTGVGTATNDGATWDSYSYAGGAQAWETAGGFGPNDCEQTDIGTCSFASGEAVGTVKTFVLTPTTKAAMDLGFGWEIKSDTEVLDLYGVYSSLDSTPANRPQLTIVYTVPATGGVLRPNPLDGLGSMMRGLNG